MKKGIDNTVNTKYNNGVMKRCYEFLRSNIVGR